MTGIVVGMSTMNALFCQKAKLGAVDALLNGPLATKSSNVESLPNGVHCSSLQPYKGAWRRPTTTIYIPQNQPLRLAFCCPKPDGLKAQALDQRGFQASACRRWHHIAPCSIHHGGMRTKSTKVPNASSISTYPSCAPIPLGKITDQEPHA